MTTAELAGLLNVKSVTIRRWLKKGKISSIILPNRRHIFEPKKVISALEKSRPDEIKKEQLLSASKNIYGLAINGKNKKTK